MIMLICFTSYLAVAAFVARAHYTGQHIAHQNVEDQADRQRKLVSKLRNEYVNSFDHETQEQQAKLISLNYKADRIRPRIKPAVLFAAAWPLLFPWMAAEWLVRKAVFLLLIPGRYARDLGQRFVTGGARQVDAAREMAEAERQIEILHKRATIAQLRTIEGRDETERAILATALEALEKSDA